MTDFMDPQVAGNQISINAAQDAQIALHRKHIQALWRHIARLEEVITVSEHGEVIVQVGAAKIALKKNGDVTIRGQNITIDSSGRVNVKGSSDVTIKGSNIHEN